MIKQEILNQINLNPDYPTIPIDFEYEEKELNDVEIRGMKSVLVEVINNFFDEQIITYEKMNEESYYSSREVWINNGYSFPLWDTEICIQSVLMTTNDIILIRINDDVYRLY